MCEIPEFRKGDASRLVVTKLAAQPMYGDWLDDGGGTPSNADFRQMLAFYDGEQRKLINRFVSGELTENELMDEMYASLYGLHLEASVMGRKRAGSTEGLTEADRAFALQVMQEQAEYLVGFLQDLEDRSPRYFNPDEQSWREDRLAWRQSLYVERGYGTANWQFENASPDTAEFDWVTHADESCEDCLANEAASPWPKGTLSEVPRDGSTACRLGCKCELRRNDGVTGFRP